MTGVVELDAVSRWYGNVVAVQRHGPPAAAAHDGSAARLGEAGRTVLFSSHILEEVEQVSGTVQVMVAGRLAASGDYRTIRRLMTHRPHVFAIRSSDDRRLAVALVAEPSVSGVSLDSAGLQVSAGDYGSFTRALPRIALRERIRVRQVLPSDESLESVFSYLVGAR